MPVGSLLQASTGSWAPIFVLAIIFDYAAALLALFVLKPLRMRWLSTVGDAPRVQQVPTPAP